MSATESSRVSFPIRAAELLLFFAFFDKRKKTQTFGVLVTGILSGYKEFSKAKFMKLFDVQKLDQC